MHSPSASLLPYAGLTVVSLEQAVAAPYATSRLAQAGARVIKVERPEGDFARGYDRAVHGEASYWVWLNQGKESICLDLKQTDDLALMQRMVAEADVFVQNLAPGAAKRLGLGADDLRRRYPRLITCDISGYGEVGAKADLKAYDFLVQGESGLLSVSGPAEAYGRIGVSICDIGAGMHALIAISQALALREKTGQGSALHVSLFDSAFDWMAVPLLHQMHTGRAPQRVGLMHPSIAPYGGFETADGEMIIISIQNNREFARLCTQILGDAGLATDERFAQNHARVANRPALDAMVAAAFIQKSRVEMEALLHAADLAFGGIHSVADVATHSQARFWPQPVGDQTVQMMAPAFQADWQTQQFAACPDLGQHTTALKKEFAA
jgi:itaconate CoA-transferase